MDNLGNLFSRLLEFANHNGGLATLAAIIGVPIILFQVFQGSRQERRRLDARRLAALSTLPITLSGINAWAQEVGAALAAIYPWTQGRNSDLPPPPFAPPPSPDALIAAIERMIEAAPKHRVASTLAAIVADMQVLNSRMSHVSEYRPERLASQSALIDDNILRAAAIYSRAESLYDEARKISEAVPLNFERMAVALTVMQIYEGNHDSTHKMFVRRWQRSRANRPWYVKGSEWMVRTRASASTAIERWFRNR